MLRVTLEEFKKFKPCWLKDEEKSRRLEEIGSRKESWTAQDVLELEEIKAEDRLWSVLREELIPGPVLHEFACRIAERVLEKAGVTDERSWNGIRVKRLWVKGEATDEELAAARDAAWNAAGDAAWDAAWPAAWPAAWGAARDAARVAAWPAARDAAWGAARDAAQDAAWPAARDAAREEQVEMLKELLREEEK